MGLGAKSEHLWTAMITRIKSHEIVREPTFLSWKHRTVWMFNVSFCMEQLHKTVDDGSLIEVLTAFATDTKPVHRLQERTHSSSPPCERELQGYPGKSKISTDEHNLRGKVAVMSAGPVVGHGAATKKL